MSQREYVVGASAGAMLYLEEEFSSRAEALFAGLKGHSPALLYVPDFFCVEMVHVLLKAVRRRKVAPDDAAIAISDICSLGILAVPTSELAEDALAMAQETAISAYDACHVALSDQLDAPTADPRLVDALAGSTNGVQWVGYMPADRPGEDGRKA